MIDGLEINDLIYVFRYPLPLDYPPFDGYNLFWCVEFMQCMYVQMDSYSFAIQFISVQMEASGRHVGLQKPRR